VSARTAKKPGKLPPARFSIDQIAASPFFQRSNDANAQMHYLDVLTPSTGKLKK
jgi:hypothetical protein